MHLSHKVYISPLQNGLALYKRNFYISDLRSDRKICFLERKLPCICCLESFSVNKRKQKEKRKEERKKKVKSKKNYKELN